MIMMEQRLRASHEQFAAMIEFMERHGDLGRPQHGIEGRVRSDGLWREVGSMLNSVAGGVEKSLDKWKKVWADWKTKTKKKLFIIKRDTVAARGNRRILTSLEKRVLAIMGLSDVIDLNGAGEEGGEVAQQDSECHTRMSPAVNDESNGILELFVEPLAEQEIITQSGTGTNALHSSPHSQRTQLEVYNLTIMNPPDNYDNSTAHERLEYQVNDLQCKQEAESGADEDCGSPEQSNDYARNDPPSDHENTRRMRLTDTRKLRRRVKLNINDRLVTKRLEILEIQKQHEQMKLDKTNILLDAEIELKKLLIENAKLDIELKKNML